MVSGPRIINSETKAEMKRVLDDIQSGKFTATGSGETASTRPRSRQCAPSSRSTQSRRWREAARHDAVDQGQAWWTSAN